MNSGSWSRLVIAFAGLMLALPIAPTAAKSDEFKSDEANRPRTKTEAPAEMMRRAHFGRAMWSEFPGFRADLVITADGKTHKGTYQVDAKGEAKLELEGGAKIEWAERTLRSVVGHRFATDHYETAVEFADDDLHHPLGRLIKSTQPDEKSLWRVKGDVLTEVHRFGADSHFVITVANVHRNAEGAHLPHNFTVVTWKNEGGELLSTRHVYNEWTRVGEFDLPVKLLAINSKPGGERRVEQILLTGHQLTPAKAGDAN